MDVFYRAHCFGKCGWLFNRYIIAFNLLRKGLVILFHFRRMENESLMGCCIP